MNEKHWSGFERVEKERKPELEFEKDSVEWKEKAKQFLWQFVAHDAAVHSRIDGTLGYCAGCKADLDAVVAFVGREKTLSFEEGVRFTNNGRRMFQSGYQAGVETAIKEAENMKAQPLGHLIALTKKNQGYNEAIDDLISRLRSLLSGK